MRKKPVTHLLLFLMLFLLSATQPAFAAKRPFTLKYDNNSFSHSDGKNGGFAGIRNYRINNTDFRALTAYCTTTSERNLLIKKRQSTWGGSCYGISTLMAHVKNGNLQPWQISGIRTSSFYSLPAPNRNTSFLSTINYYQLSLFVKRFKLSNNGAYTVTRSKGKDALRKFLREVRLQGQYCNQYKEAVLFEYHAKVGKKSVDHTILCVGNNNTGSNVKLYDLNSKTKIIDMHINVANGTFWFRDGNNNLISDKNYTTLRIGLPVKTGRERSSRVGAASVKSASVSGSDEYVTAAAADDTQEYELTSAEETVLEDDPDSYGDPGPEYYSESYDIGSMLCEAFDDPAEYTDSVYIVAKCSDCFTINTSSGQTLAVRDGGVDGTMPVRSLDYISNDDDAGELIVETADFDMADIDVESDSLDLCIYNEDDFRSVEGEGLGEICLDDDWDMTLSGDSQNEYTFTVFADSYEGDYDSEGLLSSVSASASGTVSVSSEPDKLNITSDAKITDIEVGVHKEGSSTSWVMADTTAVHVDATATTAYGDASSNTATVEDSVVLGDFISINKVKHRDDKIVLSWKTVPGAEGYDLFASFQSAKLPSKPTMTVSGTDAVLTKAYKQSGYSKVTGACIRYSIKAYRTVNGQKEYFAKSKVNYTVGKNNSHSDAQKVSVKKSSYNLKAGMKAQIRARVKTAAGKSQLSKKPWVRYVSSDKSVAKVTKSGKIKAVKAGICYIHVIAVNGLTKDVKVTVN